MLRLFLATLALLATLLLSAQPTAAQIFPTSSQDPLSGSSFSTSAFAPSVTFTPDATFASADTRVPVTLTGVGPSLSTDTYAYTYSRPLTTIQGTDLGNVYSSLAANSSPTAATSNLNPNPTNLQIVPGSTGAAASSGSSLEFGTSAAASSSSSLKFGAYPGLIVLVSVSAGVLSGMGLIFV